MTKDPEDKDQIDSPQSEESHPQKEDKPSKQPDNAAVDSGSSSMAVSEELMREMVGLCKKQNETILNLKSEIADLRSNLQEVTKDVDAQKIHEVRGTVKGKHDFAPSREKFNKIMSEDNDEEAYAKKLYDNIKANNRMF